MRSNYLRRSTATFAYNLDLFASGEYLGDARKDLVIPVPQKECDVNERRRSEVVDEE
jgi:hypothetical protein